MTVPSRTAIMVSPIAVQSMANKKPSPSKKLNAAKGARPLKVPTTRELKQMKLMAHERDLKLQSRLSPRWKKAVCNAFILLFNPRETTKAMAIAESRAAVRLM